MNWGGDNIDQQSQYPVKHAERNWKFAKHAQRYMSKYFGKNLEDINYSNLCCFRTPDTSYLSSKDWELSLPLFKEYVEYINPPWLIMFGNADRFQQGQFQVERTFTLYDERYRNHKNVQLGTLFNNYPMGRVYHSNAWISAYTDEQLWMQMYPALSKMIS